MGRAGEIQKFLISNGWGASVRTMLAGDAGNRRYERLANPPKGRLF